MLVEDKSVPLHVLITRPTEKSLELADLLAKQSISSSSFPLFEYQPLASSDNLQALLTPADIIIFISVAAVTFANQSISLTTAITNANKSLHNKKQIFAVGQATQQALSNIGVKEIISPPKGNEHSEGLLNLPQLSNINHKNIVIVRGNGGREHLANQLTERGAQVSYAQSYQRVWHTLANNCAEQWFTQQINCIVVTSNDILLTLYKHLQNVAKTNKHLDDFWHQQCIWVVVSERLEKQAKKLGLIRVVNAHSANSKILSETLQALA